MRDPKSKTMRKEIAFINCAHVFGGRDGIGIVCGSGGLTVIAEALRRSQLVNCELIKSAF